MKLAVVVFVVLAVWVSTSVSTTRTENSVEKQGTRRRLLMGPRYDKCPPARQIYTTCIFTSRNCLSDTQCGEGNACCPHGCGKICKPAVKKEEKKKEKEHESPPPSSSTLSCPAATNMIGICEFRDGINCIDDTECGKGKLCCPEGCGKACKTGVPKPNEGEKDQKPKSKKKKKKKKPHKRKSEEDKAYMDEHFID